MTHNVLVRLSDAIHRLIHGPVLDLEGYGELFDLLVQEDASDIQRAAALTAIEADRKNYATAMLAFARRMRENAEHLLEPIPNLVDTCGTGGGIPSFNLSTAAAFVVAAAGGRVAKHGNRSVTSNCGSADVLEALGARIDLSMEQARGVLIQTGMMFLFAPIMHPAMKHLGPVRRALGVRTIFNRLGPLTNPSNADFQLIGYWSSDMIEPAARIARDLGIARVLAVASQDGLDEVSACGPTYACVASEAEGVKMMRLTPDHFNIPRGSQVNLAPGETIADNATILRQALSRDDESRSLAVIPNAASALWVAGLASTTQEAADIAWETIRSGKAADKLEEFVAATLTA